MTPRGAAVLAAFIAGLVGGAAILFGFGFVDLWTRGFTGNDFSVIWTGPRMLVTGADPYDPATFRQAALAYSEQPSATEVYTYPGWVAVLLAPFGALDIEAANVAWIVVGIALAAAGLAALLARGAAPAVGAMIGFALLGSEPGIVAFYSGQIDFLIVGGLALMTAWLATGRQVEAGIAGSVMLLKPQLFLLSAPAIVVLALLRGERRFLYALLGTAVVLAAASTIVLPHWWSEWLAHVPGPRSGDVRASTLPNALRDIFGPPGSFAAYALLAASVAAALAFGRSRAALPAWIAVSLAVSPYVRVYDHVVGLVPLAAAAVLIGEQRPRLSVAVTAVGAFLLVVVGTIIHATIGSADQTLSYSGLVQFALAVLILVALWPLRGARSAS